MAKNDMGQIRLGDLAEAIGLLTRIPVKSDGNRGVAAAWAWPLAGVVVALISAIIGWIALGLGLASGFVAALILAVSIVLTGAMHEDGLADCADGFWGGWEPDRRLEIMKDSHIGTYGVVALILSLIARWSLISSLIASGWFIAPLVAAAAISRVPMVALMHWLPSARKGGLSDSTGKPSTDVVILACAVAALVGLVFCGFATVPTVLAVTLVSFGFAKLALAKINGQTGDVLGASQQLGEITALATIAAIAI